MNGQRVVWPRAGEAAVEPFTVDEPNQGQVLIETICSLVSPGTERAHLAGQPNTPNTFPLYPGYSNVGTVLKAGSQVEGLAPGDRVVSYSPHASHVVQDQGWVVKVPEGLDSEQAVFACLGAVVLQGVRKARIELGECVAVIGQGLLGLLADQLSRLSGALPVVGVDVRPEPLEAALSFGADRTVMLPVDRFPVEPSVVIEVTGNPRAILDAMRICRPTGRVILLGSSRGITHQVDFYSLVHRKGLVLLGAHDWVRPAVNSFPGWWTWKDDMNTVMQLMLAGRLKTKELIAARVPWDETPGMYAKLLSGALGNGIVVKWRG